jgi:predicted esterase
MVLHGAGGNGLSEIPAYLAPAARDRVILVAPTFDQSIDFTYEMVYADLREILKQLKAHYPINQPASIITGFSWGARVAQFYSVVYIQDYGGAVIGGSREYMTVPANSPVRYAIFVGAQDFFDNVNRPQLAQAFVNNLAKQNKPAWHFEITPGVGHERVTRQIDKTFELITVLRAGNH